MRKPVVAIDGPAGSGKGTIARLLADRLGFAYLDTGILYRAVAYINVGDRNLSTLSISDLLSIPESDLRTDEISAKASEIAKLPNIREILTKLQREFVANPGEGSEGSVLDGRDIATVVVPGADYKIFVTADLEVRAKRRFDALKQANPQITYDEIYQSLAARDEQDRTRKIAPLVFTDDYVLIDTTNDSIEESLEKVARVVEKGKFSK
ncbi:MAG: cytidylate kinase [Holosporaceae bacterium]|jgi:cytidylate kinase|nr:cytidylate kinase [Holosporaceae bacterium]